MECKHSFLSTNYKEKQEIKFNTMSSSKKQKNANFGMEKLSKPKNKRDKRENQSELSKISGFSS